MVLHSKIGALLFVHRVRQHAVQLVHKHPPRFVASAPVAAAATAPICLVYSVTARYTAQNNTDSRI